MAVDAAVGDDTMKLMMCEVSGAYFYAPAIRPIYVRIADEDFEEGGGNIGGRFSVSMYGTRGAALNWREHCEAHLVTFGFGQGKSDQCVVYNTIKNIRCFMHGDDYVASGVDIELRWLANRMARRVQGANLAP